MSRLLIMLFAMLLPLQFAWSAASAYCQHEQPSEAAAVHVGHHFHSHDGDSKTSTANPLAADPDCASCHAGGAPAISGRLLQAAFIPSTTAAAQALTLPFTSALARAPDRPQWLRLA